MPTINVPDYLDKFKCIGSQCEDTCCGGWSVNIDRETYHKYKSNQHKVLAPLFKIAVSKDTSPRANSRNNFGLMEMRPDGRCYFLQEDQLCAIQKTLGAQALSHTCNTYPRVPNRFGAQQENSLGISCPEAARLILLNPEPMQFVARETAGSTSGVIEYSYQFPLNSEGDPGQMSVLNDFRALIIGILQFRQVSLGARLMLLGLLLDDAGAVLHSDKFTHAGQLLPTLQTFANALSQPEQIEAEFSKIQPNVLRKLEVLTSVITRTLTTIAAPTRFKQCILTAVDGLLGTDGPTGLQTGTPGDPGVEFLQRFLKNKADYYDPYFNSRESIFENYLVNAVFSRLFPFTRGSYLDLYRAMVFNVSILQVLLVGIAARNKGLNDALVVQMFQSFSRKVDHNASYLDVLIQSLRPDEHDSFVHVMWMLKPDQPA